MIGGLLALTLTALTAAGIAVHNATNATREHAIALSRQLAAESLSLDPGDPVTARRLAVAAWRVYPTDQASAAMTTLLDRAAAKRRSTCCSVWLRPGPAKPTGWRSAPMARCWPPRAPTGMCGCGIR